MHRALGLLLLATEGALAQSREPSRWDANVPAYGGIVDGCPCTADCTPNALETMEQASSNSVTATFDTRATLQFAYLTDEHGTIISYKAGDEAWNGALSTITFDWDASEQPTGVVPHIVYAESCADALYRNPDGTTVTTWVRQGSHGPTPRHATACTHMNMHKEVGAVFREDGRAQGERADRARGQALSGCGNTGLL